MCTEMENFIVTCSCCLFVYSLIVYFVSFGMVMCVDDIGL